MKRILYLSMILFLSIITFIWVDWRVDGFDFFKLQENKYYFQSWVSMAGAVFAFTMAISTFFIYKKSHILSLKFISFSFLLTSFAYAIIGYHTSYCKVCSDLSMCGASHNYPNYLVLISLIIFVLTILLLHIKNHITLLKLFSYGLISASALLTVILFISIQFMETPDIIPYIFTVLNLQGLIFIFPLLLIILSILYFHTIYKLTYITILIFVLISISFMPQAYHIFICNECHAMECSEFYIFSGLFMFMAVGLFIYAISLELVKKV